MGASKRIAEMLVADAARRTGRPYVSVRFGNVLGSNGSVVPIFQEQLENGEPLTITHPDMTRYFMTIPEAAWLILDAAALGASGDLFVLDMGEPVRIIDLARDLVRLAGRDPDSQPIEIVGPAPGREAARGAVLRRRAGGADVERQGAPDAQRGPAGQRSPRRLADAGDGERGGRAGPAPRSPRFRPRHRGRDTGRSARRDAVASAGREPAPRTGPGDRGGRRGLIPGGADARQSLHGIGTTVTWWVSPLSGCSFLASCSRSW